MLSLLSLHSSDSDLFISYIAGVQNRLINMDESIYIPVTKAEYTVLVSAFNVWSPLSLSLPLCDRFSYYFWYLQLQKNMFIGSLWCLDAAESRRILKLGLSYDFDSIEYELRGISTNFIANLVVSSSLCRFSCMPTTPLVLSDTLGLCSLQFILPYLLGWHAYASTIKPEDSSRANNANPRYGGDYEWNR